MKYLGKGVALAKKMLDYKQPWLKERILQGKDSLDVIEIAKIVSTCQFGEIDNGIVSPTGYHYNRFGSVSVEDAHVIMDKVMSTLKGE